MPGSPFDKIDAGARRELLETGQGKGTLFLHLMMESKILSGISLTVGQLSSNGYLNMQEHIRKVDSIEGGIGIPISELVNISGVKF